MSPEGEIVKLDELAKTDEQLKAEGYVELTLEELQLMESLPEDKRHEALKAYRMQQVRDAAFGELHKMRQTSVSKKDKKKEKRKAKIAKASRRRNRK